MGRWFERENGEKHDVEKTVTSISRGQVDRAEWFWVALWIVVALVVTSIPPALGLIRSSPERVFGGATFAVEDVNSYLAKMREGASGEWLFHLVYTSEAHQGVVLFVFYMLLGKLAALTGLPMEVTYHLARLAFGALLLVTLYRFIAAFTAARAIRRIAFWLATFGGGLGWALLLAGQPNWLGSSPLDLILPEGFTFLVLYGFPHIALGRTLLLLGLLLLWSPDAAQIGQGVWAGLCWAAMGLVVPFYVLVVYAILFGAFVVGALGRSIDRRELQHTLLSCVIAAIAPIYILVIFTTQPVFAVWSSQNRLLSPHPAHYILAYALVGGLALASLGWAWRRAGLWRRLVGWMLVIPVLLYLPFDFANVVQRRLVEAWQVPISILAAVTLARVVLPAVRRSRPVRWLTRFPRYTSGGMQRWALSGLLILTTPTFGLLLLDQSARAVAGWSPMFHDGGEVAALDWLSARATYADVVLCAYDTGNYLPARAAARVFVGHGPETVHLAEKLPLVRRFYSTATDDGWRTAFLREWDIDVVFVGPFERALGAADLSGKPYLRLEYDAGGYQIYRVIGE